MARTFHVYMMTNRPGGTLYIGVTSDLAARIFQHRSGVVPGFTRRYNLHRLVWFEEHGDAATAIQREKRLKKWRRAWKIDLIATMNPEWRDLYPDICR